MSQMSLAKKNLTNLVLNHGQLVYVVRGTGLGGLLHDKEFTVGLTLAVNDGCLMVVKGKWFYK